MLHVVACGGRSAAEAAGLLVLPLAGQSVPHTTWGCTASAGSSQAAWAPPMCRVGAAGLAPSPWLARTPLHIGSLAASPQLAAQDFLVQLMKERHG